MSRAALSRREAIVDIYRYLVHPDLASYQHSYNTIASYNSYDMVATIATICTYLLSYRTLSYLASAHMPEIEISHNSFLEHQEDINNINNRPSPHRQNRACNRRKDQPGCYYHHQKQSWPLTGANLLYSLRTKAASLHMAMCDVDVDVPPR